MIRESLLAAILISLVIAAAPRPANAQTGLEWHIDSADAEGSGCPPGEAEFITFGADAAVLFSAFTVSLPGGGPDKALIASSNCSVRIPATLQSGFRLTQVQETLTYGVNKSDNASGRITSLATFFNAPLEKFLVRIPFGALDEPALTTTQTTPLRVSSACNGQSLSGSYESEMEITGRRANERESVIISMEGLDIHYDIVASVVPCRSR